MIFPRTDILDLCKVRDATFWPMWRQELSRVAGGKTQAKDLGSPLWRASFTTAPADRHSDGVAIEAALISLNGSVGSFLAYDVRRPYPIAHRNAAFSDTATIGALDAGNAFNLTLTGLASGITLSPGDYLGFQYGAEQSRALHMVMIGGTTNGQGDVTLEVRPSIRPGALAGAAVTLKRAPCEMILEPGGSPPTLRDLTASAVSFSAIQIL